MSLQLTAAASVPVFEIHKKILRFGRPLDLAQQATTLVISNEELEDSKEIVTFLNSSNLLIKDDSQP